jgi:hypothetical protein
VIGLVDRGIFAEKLYAASDKKFKFKAFGTAFH